MNETQTKEFSAMLPSLDQETFEIIDTLLIHRRKKLRSEAKSKTKYGMEITFEYKGEIITAKVIVIGGKYVRAETETLIYKIPTTNILTRKEQVK